MNDIIRTTKISHPSFIGTVHVGSDVSAIKAYLKETGHYRLWIRARGPRRGAYQNAGSIPLKEAQVWSLYVRERGYSGALYCPKGLTTILRNLVRDTIPGAVINVVENPVSV